MKRSFFAIIVIAAVSISAQAKEPYSGGSGTSDDPYQIANAADILELAANTSDYGANFIVTADIDLAGHAFTTAVIGTDVDNSDCDFDGTPFTGVFDGVGHKINKMTINTNGAENDFLGLFAYSCGEIKNLRLTNIKITGGNSSYFIGGLTGNNCGSINNCSSSGTITGGIDLADAGGLVGDNFGSISNCSSTININGKDESAFIGGLVGYSYEGIISNCVSTGNVMCGSDSWYLGGLVGYNCDGNIDNCHSTGNVTGGDDSVEMGGLVGENTGNITGCYSTGAIRGTDSSYSLFYLGGLAGVNHKDGIISSSYSISKIAGGNDSGPVGGLVGENNGNIINSFSTGAVTSGVGSYSIGGLTGDNEGDIRSSSYEGAVVCGAGSGDVGGLVGYTNLGDIIDCFATGSITVGNDSDNIGGLVGYCADGNIIDCCSTAAVTGADESDYLGGLIGENYGSINNCFSRGAVAGGNNSYYIGGLVGCNHAYIIKSFSTGSIKGGYELDFVGGFIGLNDANINECFSIGKVFTGNNSWDVGGLVGYHQDGNIISCCSTGSVRGGDNPNYFGGLVGLGDQGSIINCFAQGDVETGNKADGIGGLVGANSCIIRNSFSTGSVRGGVNSWDIGGFVGYNGCGNIYNCYSSGAVSGGENTTCIGGLVGNNYDGKINNCYSTGKIEYVNDWDCTSVLIGDSFYPEDVNGCYFLDSRGPDNGFGTPLTDEQMKQQASFIGWDFAGESINGTQDIWSIYEGVGYPKLPRQLMFLQINNCTITAGKNGANDSISVSGTIDATADDLTIAKFVTGSIKVAFNFDTPATCIITVPINNTDYQMTGKFSYSGIEEGIKKTFKADLESHKFSFTAKNADLSGLSCPLKVRIDIGDFNAQAELDETIVNGKRPMPIVLMMGVKNSLRVDKIKVKQSTKLSSDQLTVQGGFAVEDRYVNMTDWDLNITLNGEPYTIEAGKLIRKKNGFGCSKVELVDGSIASVDFNFKTCSFKATIKNADIPEIAGPVEFGVMFGGDYEENVEVELP